MAGGAAAAACWQPAAQWTELSWVAVGGEPIWAAQWLGGVQPLRPQQPVERGQPLAAAAAATAAAAVAASSGSAAHQPLAARGEA